MNLKILTFKNTLKFELGEVTHATLRFQIIYKRLASFACALGRNADRTFSNLFLVRIVPPQNRLDVLQLVCRAVDLAVGMSLLDRLLRPAAPALAAILTGDASG